MGYYSKEDYVLLRDEPGAKDGSLELWEFDTETWVTYGLFKRHLGQNVLCRSRPRTLKR